MALCSTHHLHPGSLATLANPGLSKAEPLWGSSILQTFFAPAPPPFEMAIKSVTPTALKRAYQMMIYRFHCENINDNVL